MITAINKVTNQAQNLIVNGDGRLLIETCPRYVDLGLLVNGDSGGNGYQLAAGAIASVPVQNDVAWVRSIVLIFKGTAGASLQFSLRRISPDEVAESETAISLSSTASWGSTVIGLATGTSGSTSALGKMARIAIKNNGASAADAWCYVQLLG